MTSKEGAITIGGREFRFLKPTIATFIEILKRNYEERFTSLDFKKIIEGDIEYKKFEALWREFCNSIFEKSFLWRMLKPLGYLPRELKFDSLLMSEIGVVIQSFFDWQGGGQKPQVGQIAPSGGSEQGKT